MITNRRAATRPRAVWIVDDDRSIRWVLEKALAREGIPFKTFATAYEVLQALSVSEPQVLVSDIRMPGESGLALLTKMKERHPQIPVIIMTAYSDLDSAVAAFQGGAFEYLPKPFDVDHAIALIRRATTETAVAPCSGRRDQRDTRDPGPGARDAGSISRHRPPVAVAHHGHDDGRVGDGEGARGACAAPAQPARRDAVRRDQYRGDPKRTCSNRSCSATNAVIHGRAGAAPRRFQQAEGGTLFLDEIGDMPPDLQVRLLRVLADGEYYRVGGHARCAPVSASSRPRIMNLKERVRQGLFREDLMHRLDVVRLRLPPLREKPDDIAPLARHFLLKEWARNLAVEPKTLSEEALDVLMQFAFPGNVRQLENVCHWLTVMAPGQRIGVADLPPEVREAPGPAGRRAIWTGSTRSIANCCRRWHAASATSATGWSRSSRRRSFVARSHIREATEWKRRRGLAGAAIH